jgi:hypothetical protein
MARFADNSSAAGDAMCPVVRIEITGIYSVNYSYRITAVLYRFDDFLHSG